MLHPEKIWHLLEKLWPDFNNILREEEWTVEVIVAYLLRFTNPFQVSQDLLIRPRVDEGSFGGKKKYSSEYRAHYAGDLFIFVLLYQLF